MMQDALRGSALRQVPFFDQAKVVRLLDRLPTMQPGEQVAIDQILMLLLSASVLGERFALAA
jgi:asparagine synthase (glutamine-hydrolysing)